MKYYEVAFTMEPCSEERRDVLSAMAGEAGFESFEETPEGLTGYVQQSVFDRMVLDSLLEAFPFDGTAIHYEVREAEDRDWNEQWEQEGFAPIVVDDGCGRPRLVIHDGRHLPEASALTVEIDAHLAFGTGTHETTRMICATLLDLYQETTYGNVLDCGCGTGILAITALKLGAHQATAYDIDEWSVDNTRHNAVINGVDDRLDVLHGDATLLASTDASYDLVVANINRNILLQDMPAFARVMTPGARLVLSGFYRDDCPLLEQQGRTLGLRTESVRHDGDWASIVLSKLPER